MSGEALALKQAQVKLFEEWRLSPEKFVRDVLKPERFNRGDKIGCISNQQLAALEAVRKIVTAKMDKYDGFDLDEEEIRLSKLLGVSIMSGQGCGKDTFCAWLIIWFLFCFNKALVPCTAPSAHQLRDILWKEVSKWLTGSLAEDWLVWQTDRVFHKEAGGKEWFAVARTASKHGSEAEQEGTLRGFHEHNMMIILDEASEVPDSVFKPLQGTLTDPINFMIVIFNPTRSSGFAHRTQFENRDLWTCLRWNAEESSRVTQDSIDLKIREYGEESNHYRINVLGLPPLADKDALIPRDWVLDAVDKPVIPFDRDVDVFGVDVGAGGDESVLIRRCGMKVYELETVAYDRSEDLISWIMGKAFRYEPEYIMIDSIGWGWGIVGALRDRLRCNVIGVNVSDGACNGRYVKLRDELWWRVRESFETGCISIPDDGRLIEQLTMIRYTEPGGKVKIESKKELAKRNCKSPDRADALCLTEYLRADMLRAVSGGNDNWRRRSSVDWRVA